MCFWMISSQETLLQPLKYVFATTYTVPALREFLFGERSVLSRPVLGFLFFSNQVLCEYYNI